MNDININCDCCKDSGQVNCNSCFGQKNIWMGVSDSCLTGWKKCTNCSGTGKLTCPSNCSAKQGRDLMSRVEVLRTQEIVDISIAAEQNEQHAVVLHDD